MWAVRSINVMAPCGVIECKRWIIAWSFFSWLSAIATSDFSIAQETVVAQFPRSAVSIDSRFETPEKTILHFRKAVAKCRWRDEYDCYTGAQQARFSYFIIVSTREMSDSKDLAPKVELVLQKYHVPKGLVDRFPSMRMELTANQDERFVDSLIKAHHQELELRIKRWEAEVQPLAIDWSNLIGELQPLFIENSRRYQGEHHPSQAGIVAHLNYHLYDRVWDLQTKDSQAHGTIVARIRDTDVVIQHDDSLGPVERLVAWSSPVFNWKNLASANAWHGCVGREPEKITLVRQSDGWKINAIPFR